MQPESETDIETSPMTNPVMTASGFAALRRKLKLTQGQAAVALGIEREHLRELESGRRPVYQLHRLALEQVRWQMAAASSDIVTGNMLACAQKILESVGYSVIPKSSR
jgi:DNA-binding XRE family transcriptional regulator